MNFHRIDNESKFVINNYSSGGGGGTLTSTTITASGVLGTDQIVLADASAGPITATLPSATTSAQLYYIFKIDSSSNQITVVPQSGEYIDGVLNGQIALAVQNDRYYVVSSGPQGWYCI
jgi:hypothetical protein